ncbi:hypothetical protein A33Q_0894 [Indibacter alkaliphilus LW1]|uniref:SusD family protein n=1 Tax=Indibacter alkaliphilus (strain CCUG 57479 / KCTC 22604 / LW1) TaxID=1189612 RepID=S2E338_INDAL|nr:RagB/SusD family nutrient uptake outer membrane protein [Indibacter alkaliphilus]EOZ98911.1 hypothetical protein A33Q_0894 [Indibacter alkaliphilus LW1]
MKTYWKKSLPMICLIWLIAGCTEFLDEKPDISMVVPRSLDELQGLLDDSVLRRMNTGPSGAIISADDIRLSENGFAIRTILDRQMYTWDKELMVGVPNFSDWSITYQQVFNANLVLDRIESIEPKTSQESIQKQEIIGRALFYRSFAFHHLMEIFCLPYNPSTASANLGLPLRKSSNINIQVQRSSLEETFQLIMDDLREALELLPDRIDVITRPSKVSANALLARLSMIAGDFDAAVTYASNAIALGNGLMDYSQINSNLIIPIPFTSNTELIFHQSAGTGSLSFSPETLVSDEVFDLYGEGDLRKEVFFRAVPSGFNFNGNYSGQTSWFTGLAMDEVYLNLAESLARLGRGEEAVDYLNELLEKRFDPEYFVPVGFSDDLEILERVIVERRKTLCFRPTRWMDLRRYNQEPSRAKTLVREAGGQVYRLEPNSVNYALPIPENDIELGGLEQNKRE